MSKYLGIEFKVSFGPQDVFTISEYTSGLYWITWIEKGKTVRTSYPEESVIRLLKNKTWRVLNKPTPKKKKTQLHKKS